MYRASGIGVSIVLIATGAILAWAVTAHANGVNINTVGLILFFVGLAGLLVSLLVGLAPVRERDTTVVDRPVERRPVERIERY